MLAKLELDSNDVQLIKSLLGKECAKRLTWARNIASGRHTRYGTSTDYISADGIEVNIQEAMRYVDVMKRLGSDY